MTFNKFAIRVLVAGWLVLSFACNSSTPTEVPPLSGLPNGMSLTPMSGNNVMSFSVNGSNCSWDSGRPYQNKPCVTVTICNPGTSSSNGQVCTTVNDILLDTGSYGLRVFRTAIPNLTLTQETATDGGALAECVEFGDGSTDWGQVQKADVVLGGESAVTVPIQVIDANYATVPARCGNPDANVAAAGFNGILGVGLFAQDCGTSCTGSHTSNGRYFSCGTNGCVGGSTTTIADQVINPVAALPTDNNGVIVQLPLISTNGVGSTNGYLVLGIGTQTNNVPPTGAKTYTADSDGNFSTTYSGMTYDSFLDTGSNGLFIDASSQIPICADGTWFCPSSVTTYSSVTQGSNNVVSSTVQFQIGNANTLIGSNNRVFSDLGGSASGMFDYGLPFYFGRNVYVGIKGKTSTLGTGPYWSY